MNRIRLILTIVAALMLGASPAMAADVIDQAEQLEDSINEFKGSTCGKAISSCWRGVGSAVRATNQKCRAFRKCRKKCRSAKRSGKQTCIASRCKKLNGKAKTSCKKSCRKGSRMLKRSCFRSCGKRPPECKRAWGGVLKAVKSCTTKIKDSNCKSWAKRIQELAKSIN